MSFMIFIIRFSSLHSALKIKPSGEFVCGFLYVFLAVLSLEVEIETYFVFIVAPKNHFRNFVNISQQGFEQGTQQCIRKAV